MSFWRWNTVNNGLEKCQVAWFDIRLIWNCGVFINRCELHSSLNPPFNISTHKKCFRILQKLWRPFFNCRISLCWLSSKLGQKRISRCDTRQKRPAKVLMMMSVCFDVGCSIVVCNCISNDAILFIPPQILPESAEECGLCYGVKRRKESRSGTSQNPQTPTPNLTSTKNTNHTFYSVRGDFWGMHRIDLIGT